jgi:hypothetical protein
VVIKITNYLKKKAQVKKNPRKKAIKKKRKKRQKFRRMINCKIFLKINMRRIIIIKSKKIN